MRKALGHGVAILTISVLAYSVILGAHAELAPIEGQWYLGEGAQEWMTLSYSIYRYGENSTRVFEMTILLKRQNMDGDWLSEFTIIENATKARGDVLLRDVDLYPVTSLGNSTDVMSYFDDYKQSIQHLGAWTTKTFPLSLQARSWDGLACEGCPTAGPVGSETIGVASGTFNTTLVRWGSQYNIWILDDFPYPVKGETNLFPHPTIGVTYSFELIDATIGGVVFGSDKAVKIYGTIHRESCERIGGVILTQLVDTSPPQTVDVCKYTNRYFRLVEIEPTFFGEVGGHWVDPETANSYMFGYLIDFPTPCKAESLWDAPYAHRNFQTAKLHVIYENKTFDIGAKTWGSICEFAFDEHQKSVTLLLKSLNGNEGSAVITVPDELLGGELSMQVGGNTVNVTRLVDPYHKPTTTSLRHEFTYPELPQPSNATDITSQELIMTGTTVVPEFGAVLLPVTVLVLSSVIASAIYGRYR